MNAGDLCLQFDHGLLQSDALGIPGPGQRLVVFEEFAFLDRDGNRPIEVAEFVVGDLHLADHLRASGGDKPRV